MSEDTKKIETPVYITSALFTRFINSLRNTTIPSRIDRSVLSKMSGGEQSGLIAGLKFLGLIAADGSPTEKMMELVESEGDAYKAALRSILTVSYGFLFNSDIDLTKATGQQVADKFREMDIQGSTVTKCMAFFLQAAKEAGIEISQHVTPPRVPSNGVKKKRPKDEMPPTPTPTPPPTPLTPEAPVPGMEKITVSLRNKAPAVVHMPEGLEGDEARRAVRVVIFNLNNYYGLDEEDG